MTLSHAEHPYQMFSNPPTAPNPSVIRPLAMTIFLAVVCRVDNRSVFEEVVDWGNLCWLPSASSQTIAQ